jgi:hypothetical protein
MTNTLLSGALRSSSSVLVEGDPLPIADLVSLIQADTKAAAPIDLRQPQAVLDDASLRAAVDKALAKSAAVIVLVGNDVPAHVTQVVGEIAGGSVTVAPGKVRNDDRMRVVVLAATKTTDPALASACAVKLDAQRALSARTAKR